jgi:hypothetical protein
VSLNQTEFIDLYSISTKARARLNAIAMCSVSSGTIQAAVGIHRLFQILLGLVLGTSAGTHVFLEHGWRAGAGLSVGLMGCTLLLLLLRGPHCKQYTWFGYEGGMEWRKEVLLQKNSSDTNDSSRDSEK